MSYILRTNYMDGVSVLGGRNTNQKIIWLDVTVNEGLVVNSLNACNLSEKNNQTLEGSNPRGAVARMLGGSWTRDMHVGVE